MSVDNVANLRNDLSTFNVLGFTVTSGHSIHTYIPTCMANSTYGHPGGSFWYGQNTAELWCGVCLLPFAVDCGADMMTIMGDGVDKKMEALQRTSRRIAK